MKACLLKDRNRAGLYHLPAHDQDSLPQLVAKARLRLVLVDLAADKGRQEILRQIGDACSFPAWYGINFDALHDCLTDPDWQSGKGVVLLIAGLDSLQATDPEGFTTFIDVLRSAAETRSQETSPLWIFLATPVSGVANLPDA